MSCHSCIHKGPGVLVGSVPVTLASTPEQCLASPEQLEELRVKMAQAGFRDRDVVAVHSSLYRQVFFLEELSQQEAWDWLTLVEWAIRRNGE